MPPREQPPGVFHITSRGVDRRPIFEGDETRLSFYRLMARMKDKHGGLIHSWCLMTNHYHIAYETFDVGRLSAAFQYLNSTYARVYNEIVGRSGYLFESPFESELVETERHAICLSAYIPNNPVRANMRRTAADYPWSSFRALAGLAPKPSFLSTAWVYGLFGEDDETARAKYVAWVADHAHLARKDLSAAAMSSLRSGGSDADRRRAASGAETAMSSLRSGLGP
jgi:putative transposase